MENIDSNFVITKRKILTLNELKDYNYNSKSINLELIDTNPITLETCTLNTNNLDINFNKFSYKKYIFYYKEFEFKYTLKLHLDLVKYSEKLKYQYCYGFEEDKSALRYIEDKYNNDLLKKIANDFLTLKDYNFNESEIFEIVIRFIQELPYDYTLNSTNKYPYETLYYGKGVCLDKTIILAKLLEYLGYESYIVIDIFEPETNIPHSVVGIFCEQSNYYLDNKPFCLIETTSTFLINELSYSGNITPLKISSGKDYYEDSYGPKTLEKYQLNNKEMEFILELLNKEKNPKIYNKYVEEYNNLLYENRKIKFDIYE
jgi:hypothetical protein